MPIFQFPDIASKNNKAIETFESCQEALVNAFDEMADFYKLKFTYRKETKCGTRLPYAMFSMCNRALLRIELDSDLRVNIAMLEDGDEVNKFTTSKKNILNNIQKRVIGSQSFKRCIVKCLHNTDF